MLRSGEVQAVEGIPRSLSVGQVVWAPSTEGTYQYLVFVGWTSDTRKLGIKYCYNRPCALYVARISNSKSEVNEPELKWVFAWLSYSVLSFHSLSLSLLLKNEYSQSDVTAY